MNKRTDFNEELYKQCMDYLSGLGKSKENLEWLQDTTEEWIKERALYNAITDAIEVMNGDTKNLGKGDLPELLSDALSVGFDSHVGHDYIDNWEARFDYYHKKEFKIPMSTQRFNEITKGGLSRKTLNIFLAGTNVGKTLLMCAEAAYNLIRGNNVLYITAEVSEEEIARRVDVNLLDVPFDDLEYLSKTNFSSKIGKIKTGNIGKLKIKEYPTSSANVGHIRLLLRELKIKEGFVPDIIYIDYINIFQPLRKVFGSGTYEYIKVVAEEFRGLGVEYNVPIVSATQLTRGAFDSSDISLTDTSESWGLPATADFMVGVVSTEEIGHDKFMIKQLKSRYNNKDKMLSFMIGVDKDKQRLYDLSDDDYSEDFERDIPIMDNTAIGEFMTGEL